MVVVEGLSLMIFLKQRLLQTFQQTLFMDICVGIMDEYAGLHISGRIDMCVLPPSCNTSVDVFAVILEVNAENLLTAGQARISRTLWIIYSLCSAFSIRSTFAPSPIGI